MREQTLERMRAIDCSPPEDSDNIRVLIGRTVKRFREALGVTQLELASDMGASTSFVLSLEQGNINVDLSSLEICAHALYMDVKELLMAALTDAQPIVITELEATQ